MHLYVLPFVPRLLFNIHVTCYHFGLHVLSGPSSAGQGAAGFHLCWLRYVSMSPSVMETECQLDVPVTKLSILSASQIHHGEMGPDPRQQKPTAPQIHTNMQINNKINITPQTSHPSMTSL